MEAVRVTDQTPRSSGGQMTLVGVAMGALPAGWIFGA